MNAAILASQNRQQRLLGLYYWARSRDADAAQIALRAMGCFGVTYHTAEEYGRAVRRKLDQEAGK